MKGPSNETILRDSSHAGHSAEQEFSSSVSKKELLNKTMRGLLTRCAESKLRADTIIVEARLLSHDYASTTLFISSAQPFCLLIIKE